MKQSFPIKTIFILTICLKMFGFTAFSAETDQSSIPMESPVSPRETQLEKIELTESSSLTQQIGEEHLPHQTSRISTVCNVFFDRRVLTPMVLTVSPLLVGVSDLSPHVALAAAIYTSVLPLYLKFYALKSDSKENDGIISFTKIAKISGYTLNTAALFLSWIYYASWSEIGGDGETIKHMALVSSSLLSAVVSIGLILAGCYDS